jgi:Flp pilus assembly protein TadG
MQTRIPVSKARRRKSAGLAPVIEMVFTLLPMLALILGIVDFGFMIFRWTTLQNAVREGTRYAVTFQRNGALGQDASVEGIVQTYALGIAKTTDSPQTIFVKYYNPNTLVQVGSGGNVPGNLVEVSVQGLAFSWIAPLSGDYALVRTSGTGSGSSGTYYRSTTPLTLNVYSSDILGGFPVGVNSVPE